MGKVSLILEISYDKLKLSDDNTRQKEVRIVSMKRYYQNSINPFLKVDITFKRRVYTFQNLQTISS